METKNKSLDVKKKNIHAFTENFRLVVYKDLSIILLTIPKCSQLIFLKLHFGVFYVGFLLVLLFLDSLMLFLFFLAIFEARISHSAKHNRELKNK